MNNESTKAESHLRASLLQEALWGDLPMQLTAAADSAISLQLRPAVARYDRDRK